MFLKFLLKPTYTWSFCNTFRFCVRAPLAGKIYVVLVAIDVFILFILELINPKKVRNKLEVEK